MLRPGTEACAPCYCITLRLSCVLCRTDKGVWHCQYEGSNSSSDDSSGIKATPLLVLTCCTTRTVKRNRRNPRCVQCNVDATCSNACTALRAVQHTYHVQREVQHPKTRSVQCNTYNIYTTCSVTCALLTCVLPASRPTSERLRVEAGRGEQERGARNAAADLDGRRRR